jgi:hypothetical protein|tara:strand:- start:455 stop:691 length:237 start_codon:yes stop_codon:yes gene_type:complete
MKTKEWEKEISKFLVGKKIKRVEYLTEENGGSWNQLPLAIVFTDGSWIFPMADDEGNNGGALATSSEELPTIPVMWGN